MSASGAIQYTFEAAADLVGQEGKLVALDPAYVGGRPGVRLAQPGDEALGLLCVNEASVTGKTNIGCSVTVKICCDCDELMLDPAAATPSPGALLAPGVDGTVREAVAGEFVAAKALGVNGGCIESKLILSCVPLA